MRMIEETKVCLSKYATFSGRASRPEYWWFILAVLLASIVTSLIDSALFGPTITDVTTTDPATGELSHRLVAAYGSGPISRLLSMLTFLPILAAGWRRMHDIGHPGWFLLLPLVVFAVGVGILMLGVGGLSALGGGAGGTEGGSGALFILGAGAALFLALAQIAAMLLILWWLARPNQAGPNQFGPEPPR